MFPACRGGIRGTCVIRSGLMSSFLGLREEAVSAGDNGFPPPGTAGLPADKLVGDTYQG